MAAGAENGGGPDSSRRLMVWTGAAALMLLPLLAMRGFDAAAWDPPEDLVFLAILLAGTGGTYELATRVSDRDAYRAAIGFALAAALLQSWINLAVGIIGSDDNPANWIYAGVLGVAAAGAVVARFKPLGMAHAMTAAAVAQVAAFVLALIAGLGFTGPITVFFASLWLISAWLFRRAARGNVAASAA